MSINQKNKYYIGLDIGTNSVGWAVTDENYNLRKAHCKSMWGSHLFESSGSDKSKTAERRMKRAERRRGDRKKNRIKLLQELFANEMYKVDPEFFIRLNSSRLYLNDKPLKDQSKYPLFANTGKTDVEYYQAYPTIYHLRKDLIHNPSEHDIREVYLAIHHILKHRGHFLIEGSFSEATDYGYTFDSFLEALYQFFQVEDIDRDEFRNVIVDKHMAKSDRAKALNPLLRLDPEFYDNNDLKKRAKGIMELCKLIVGNKGNIAKIFDDDFSGLESSVITIADENYELETREQIFDFDPTYCLLLDSAKALHDWAILHDVLNGEQYISDAKVSRYEEHKRNLKALKSIIRTYKPEIYCAYFGNDVRKSDRKSKGLGYVNYIGGVKNTGKKYVLRKCSDEDFYKNLAKILDSIKEKISEDDLSLFNDLVIKTEAHTLLPKQKSKDNGVVPHQVHENELLKILENASSYLPFLKEKDDTGLSMSEKILAIFRFRIPYYIGPLSKRHVDQGSNAWIVRKKEGYIYPWNFDEIVDKEASNIEFIRRMTNKCTYIVGEDVIPANSLLYKEFTVLNELNNLRIRGRKVSHDEKQLIYEKLFKKKKNVKGEQLLNFLKQDDAELSQADLSGFDKDFKSNLSSYLDFEKKLFGKEICLDRNKQFVEDVIEWKTIYGDDTKMVNNMIRSKYPHFLTKEQLKKLNVLRYSGWGNFSKKFLNGIKGINKETGQQYTIIEALREEEDNLMQLLSSKYTFTEVINKYNQEHQPVQSSMTYDSLIKDLYATADVKRAIWRSVRIVREIVNYIGYAPAKIFVETPRQDGKKKRTVSRKARLLQLYEKCKEEYPSFFSDINKRDERSFNSIKLYLYYTQRGRCMYTGKPIDLSELLEKNSKWDRDHIYPQSLVKDDSLDNLVLVDKTENSKKSNGLISPDIQRKMRSTWKSLLEGGFISQKKYDRLTRKDEFSDDEKAGFIQRQIVETGQSTKEVLHILEELYPDTDVYSVKAKLASDFRQRDLNMLKCRLLNDYHHAKDAYLNIVVGNVYYSKFTRDPRQWLKKNTDAHYHMNKLFDRDVYYSKQQVWEKPVMNPDGSPAKDESGNKFGGTLDKIRKTMRHNDVFYTEMAYCDKGELFNATQVSKDGKSDIPLKKGLPVEKYGGYNSANTAYFALVMFKDKKGNPVKNILEVPIYIANMLEYQPTAFAQWLSSVKGIEDATIIKPMIRKNALLIVNGFPMRIRGVSGINILFKGALQCVLNQYEEIIRRVEKISQREEMTIDEKRDGINDKSLEELYVAIVDKLKTAYEGRPANKAASLEDHFNDFQQLDLADKVSVLSQMLVFISCGAATTADLSKLSMGPAVGSMKINKNTLGKSEIIQVNQSITGIFESRIRL